MTEQEWLDSKDPEPMLQHLSTLCSDRKFRLFAVACCEQVLHLMEDERSKTAVRVAERFADGYASSTELAWAARAARARELQAKLLRDIVGNPFRPILVDPLWQSRPVLALTQNIYDLKRWEDMPILADALEESGCIDETVLTHCRGDGPHVRGCWVVDLLLNKT